MKKIVLILLFFVFTQVSNAQCAMCKAVVESGGNVSEAEGLNSGILYLMIDEIMKMNDWMRLRLEVEAYPEL